MSCARSRNMAAIESNDSAITTNAASAAMPIAVMAKMRRRWRGVSAVRKASPIMTAQDTAK